MVIKYSFVYNCSAWVKSEMGRVVRHAGKLEMKGVKQAEESRKVYFVPIVDWFVKVKRMCTHVSANTLRLNIAARRQRKTVWKPPAPWLSMPFCSG